MTPSTHSCSPAQRRPRDPGGSRSPRRPGRDILPGREAAGPAGLLPLSPPYLRSRQARGAVGPGGGRRGTGADLSGLPARSGRRAGGPGPVRGLRVDPFVGHPGKRGVPSLRACRWWWCGRLAQLEERRPYKAKVGGSSPSAPTDPQVSDGGPMIFLGRRRIRGPASRPAGQRRSCVRVFCGFRLVRICHGCVLIHHPARCEGALYRLVADGLAGGCDGVADHALGRGRG